MPAKKFTKKAVMPKEKRQWRHVYESSLKRGDSKGTAIRKANAVVHKSKE